MLDTVLDVASAVLMLAGAFLSFAAGVGVLRFPDLLARMHAATKPQVLGLILVLVGLELQLRTWRVALVVVLVVLFQMLTAPVSAHMVGRAGYRTGKVRTDLLVMDELTADVQQAALEADHAGIARLAAELADEAVHEAELADEVVHDAEDAHAGEGRPGDGDPQDAGAEPRRDAPPA